MLPNAETSGEIVLPFVSMREFIDLAPVGHLGSISEASGDNIGVLSCVIYNDLLHASLATAPDISIQVFAWMEEESLHVPTPYAVLEGDEYSSPGPVSRVSSAVASVAGALKDVPIIGTFARATEIGAGALASIANIFGWSRPAQIEDTIFVKNVPFGTGFSVGAGADTATKMTLDPKAEVFVNPELLGLNPDDSMTIAHIAGRESYFDSATWTGTHSPGTLLAEYPVTPGLYRQHGSGTLDFEWHETTPLYWLSRGFAYWTGSLVFRIQIVATKFHRGRVRIVYFPRGSAVLPAVDYSNSSWNTVLDLSAESEIEFSVPWSQAAPWLSASKHELGTVDPTLYRTNGVLGIFVLNTLAGNDSVPLVNVNVYVRGGDDFKLAKPYASGLQNYTFASDRVALPAGFKNSYLTADLDAAASCYSTDMSGPITVALEGANDFGSEVVNNSSFPGMHFGEAIASIRPLLKRSSTYIQVLINNTSGYRAVKMALPAQPYDIYSTASTAQYIGAFGDTVGLQTFLTWFRTGFVCARGGVRYRVAFSDASVADTVRMDQSRVTASLTDDVPFYCGNVDAKYITYATGNGTSLNLMTTQAGVEFEVPYYYPTNFVLGPILSEQFAGLGSDQISNLSRSTPTLYFNELASNLSGANRFQTVEVYVSAAEDFTLDWFLCAPPLLYMIGTNGRSL
jgi:hypothetical protein